MKVNDSIHATFKLGVKILTDSHYSTLAIAVTGAAFLIFGNSLSIPCFAAVTGYLFTKCFVMISDKYDLINFDQLKAKIFSLQAKPAYYKLIAFLITITVSTLIMPVGLVMALAFGSFLALTTEFKRYNYNMNIDGFTFNPNINSNDNT